MKHGYQRFNQYPKGSTLWLHIRCYDEVVSEQELLKKFDERYQRNNEFGREYFIGDVHDMMEVILQYVGHTCNLSALVDEHSKQFESLQQKLDDQTACAIRLTKEKLLLQKELERVTNQIEDDMIKLWPPPASVNSSINCTMNNEIDQENSSSNDEGTLRNICERCNKKLCNTQSYNYHIQICNGHDSRTCPTCLRKFASHRGRWKHMRTVKCTPPPPPPSTSSSNASLNCTIKASNIHVVHTMNNEIDQENSSSKTSKTDHKPRCNACKKEFVSNKCYKQHTKVCKGHDSKTCRTCKKQFNSYQARWKHMRTVKCTPPPPPPGSSSNASLNCTIKASNIHVVSTCNDFLNLGMDPQNSQLT